MEKSNQRLSQDDWDKIQERTARKIKKELQIKRKLRNKIRQDLKGIEKLVPNGYAVCVEILKARSI